jgi:argininosuccinate synthase
MRTRVVLGYSGGLGSSAAMAWLTDAHAAEVVTVTLDLGQGTPLEEVRDRALAAGAARAHVLDARDEFVRGYVLPALKADATYEDGSPMPAALSRPLIVRKLVEVAAMEGASALAHGSSSGGVDLVRLDAAAHALNPSLRVLAPVREWSMSPAGEAAYARARGVPLPPGRPTGAAPGRSNLWGRSFTRGPEEDPTAWPPESAYTRTRTPEGCPDEPAHVDVRFENGEPIAVNGVPMAPVDLIAALDLIAGANGVGRTGTGEAAERGEAPAAVVLHAAHRELQRVVTAADLARECLAMSATYAGLVHHGLWFTPTRGAIDAFEAGVQARVTGEIRLRLFRGECTIVGRTSPFAISD